MNLSRRRFRATAAGAGALSAVRPAFGTRTDQAPRASSVDPQGFAFQQAAAKTVKYRLGGRMSRNEDAMPGRTEKLITLFRKALGDKMAIHAHAIPPQSSKDRRP